MLKFLDFYTFFCFVLFCFFSSVLLHNMQICISGCTSLQNTRSRWRWSKAFIHPFIQPFTHPSIFSAFILLLRMALCAVIPAVKEGLHPGQGVKRGGFKFTHIILVCYLVTGNKNKYIWAPEICEILGWWWELPIWAAAANSESPPLFFDKL